MPFFLGSSVWLVCVALIGLVRLLFFLVACVSSDVVPSFTNSLYDIQKSRHWYRWLKHLRQQYCLLFQHSNRDQVRFLSVACPTWVQLLFFFCSSVPVVLFDIPGISSCRSQHVVSVETPSLFHHSFYLWFICFPWWSIDDWENLHADRATNYMFWAISEAEDDVGIQ